MLLASPAGPVVAQGLPSARELADSVAARYGAMKTYRDQGVLQVDSRDPVEQQFETFFSREHGFKMVVDETLRRRDQRRFAVWGDQSCLAVYMAGRSGFRSPCRPPDQFSWAGANALAQALVPGRLIPGLSRHFRLHPTARVEEAPTPDGRAAYVLVEDPARHEERRTFIDPASRYIVRFEQRRVFTGPGVTLREVVVIDYRVVEIDRPMSASAVRFSPPWYVEHEALLRNALLYAAFLGVPGCALFWLGRRYGRRATATVLGVVIRAALWSLPLSWSLVVAAAGHGAIVLPLPAWLLLGMGIFSGARQAEFVMPPPALSVIVTVGAYMVGAALGRSSLAHDQVVRAQR